MKKLILPLIVLSLFSLNMALPNKIIAANDCSSYYNLTLSNLKKYPVDLDSLKLYT